MASYEALRSKITFRDFDAGALRLVCPFARARAQRAFIAAAIFLRPAAESLRPVRLLRAGSASPSKISLAAARASTVFLAWRSSSSIDVIKCVAAVRFGAAGLDAHLIM